MNVPTLQLQSISSYGSLWLRGLESLPETERRGQNPRISKHTVNRLPQCWNPSGTLVHLFRPVNGSIKFIFFFSRFVRHPLGNLLLPKFSLVVERCLLVVAKGKANNKNHHHHFPPHMTIGMFMMGENMCCGVLPKLSLESRTDRRCQMKKINSLQQVVNHS